MRFAPQAESALRKAGWFPGRDAYDQMTIPPEFPIFPIAASVTAEFGKLHIGEIHPGIDCSTSDFYIDPTAAIGMGQEFAQFYKRYGIRFFPLGELLNGTYILVIDERGETYMYGEGRLSYIASNFDKAIENLLTGKRDDAHQNGETDRPGK